MTIARKNIFFLGIFIFLIPFLGLPTFWKTMFVCFSALILVVLSVERVVPIPSPEPMPLHTPSVPLPLPTLSPISTLKSPVRRRVVKKEKVVPESVPFKVGESFKKPEETE